MRLNLFIVALAIGAVSGCTTGRLRQRTINQGSTLPDLQYQQVLGNLALFATNPAALPWHVNLKEGTAQVTDGIAGGAALDLGPPVTWFPQLLGSRTAVAQWGMSPVTDTIELRLLRIAYRRALGIDEMPSADLLEELADELKEQIATNSDLRNESEAFYDIEGRSIESPSQLDRRIITTNDPDFYIADDSDQRELSPLVRNVRRKIAAIERELAAIQPGWFRIGRRHDVPKDACYVGHSGDSYVWVPASGLEAFTQFTFTVLRISHLIKETETLISPGSVKFSPGDMGK